MTSYNPPTRPRPSGVSVDPLHPGPLSAAALLARGFKLVASNPGPYIVWAALLPLGVHAIFTLCTSLLEAAGVSDSYTYSAYMMGGDVGGVLIGLQLLVSIVYLLVTLVMSVLLQGFVANGVRYEALGYRATAAEMWAATRPALGRLAGYMGIVLGMAVGAGLALSVVFTILIAIAFAIMSPMMAGIGSVTVVVIALVVLFSLPFFWFAARLALAPMIIVAEGSKAWPAITRSWALTRNHVWRMVGLYLLLALIGAAVGAVVGLLGWAINSALLWNASWEYGITGARVASAFVSALPSVIVSAGIAPIAATAFASAYLDVRSREDWLASSLAHYHALRQAGYQPNQLPDPFVTPPLPQQGSAQTPP